MSSNSKEFPYELFRQMHNDLQTQMMKITQLSQAEAAASSVVNANPTTPPRQNPSMYANSYAGKPASSFTAVPQQPARQQVTEKKTFEQAYREAIERLNAAAGNRTNSQQQTLPQQQRSRVQYSKSCPRQPSPPRSVINSNRFTVEPSVSVYAPSTPGSSDSQYKTTIYNINTINLAGLVKSQQNTNDGRSAAGRSAVSTSVGSTPSAPQSQSVERIMDESHRYRETFANAYARHLLEMTRTAVQKKTAQPQKPAQGGQYSSSANQSPISSQIEPGSGHLAKPLPEADLPSKKPRKSPAANPLILNGKDGAALTFAEMLSNSERKPNGNVLLTIDRKATPGTNNPNLPSLDAMMAAHSSKSKHASSSSLEKKPIESRLKPSSIKINHDEFYRQIQNKIVQHTQKLSTPSSLPAQQRVVSGATSKVVPPRQQTVIVSTRSVPVPNIGNRPDLTVIVNKPKISSPAPSHVYGKPTISTSSSTSSTGQSVSPSTSHSYSMGLCTPKRNQDSAIASLVEPPPAHSTTPKSSFVSPQTSIPVKPLTPSPLPVKETMNYGAKNLNSITPKFSKPASVTAADGVLNLDTKIPTPPSSASQNNTPNIGFDDYSLQSSTQYRTTGNRSSILFNSSQKVVKIEKRVNYDAYANAKASNSDSGTSKYQHNVVWKEQPSIKSEEHLNGSGKIFEQKKTLLELLQIANMQQVSSNPQGQTKGVSFVGRIAATAGNVTTAGALQTNHMNQTNQDLFKYRMTSKSSSKEKHRKLIDPLAIKPDPDRPPVKRKDPAKRLDLVRRKKPKLARSTDPYLQHGPCYEVAPRLSRCRECGRSAAARSRDAANIFCRFIAFRKLKYNDHGQMEVAGFADPNLDAQKADTSLWDANLTKVPIDLSVEKSKFLLGQVGYKFCELFHQEKEAYFEHMSEDKTIAWKQAVNGVREMCDVCSTTLFNYHWVCSTCGFVVCIDCYKCRKYAANNNDTGTRDRDGYMWLHCTNREPHVQEKLMLTQIIPSNSLYKLVRQMHGVCALLEIPLNCECPLSKESLFRKIKDRLEFIYPITIEMAKKSDEGLEPGSDVQVKSLSPGSSSTTKMISITIKNIESIKSEAGNGTVCCKAIFGRELSEDKNPVVEKLKHKEKQSYSFEGFQEEIKIESLEDFINKDEQQQNQIIQIKEELDIEETKETKESSPSPELCGIKIEDKENSDVKPCLAETKIIDEVKKSTENDPLEHGVGNNIQEERNIDEHEEKTGLSKESNTEEPAYSEEHRFKASPKLDWKTFNMIVKQLLKFDKSLNISGLFEKHLSEKYSDSESLVDFTAEFQVQHSNIKSFLHDFLSEFVFLTGQNQTDNLTDDVQIMEYNKYMKKGIEFQNKGERIMSLKESEKLYPNVAHQWLCNGRLLRLLDPLNDNNYNTFHDQWERGQPVMVSYVSNKLDMSLWHPQSFIEDFGDEENDLINCLNGKLVRGQKMKVFWEGFERIGYRLLDERDRPMMLKLKDWPPGDDFAEMMPTRFNDLMSSLPISEYTRREGRLNLASRLSSFFVRPDLGPKMYSAYGSALHPTKGTTNLHLDVSDAVNVMVYVAVPKDVDQIKYIQKVLDAIDSDECDVFTRQRIRDKADLPGALWHIFHAKDADKIRSLLNKIEVERGGSIKPNHDPIHDQKWYLDANLRRRLLEEYNVEAYSIVQCSGDAIFIPAGAPHQVRNLHNCVKVAEDFVSPENIAYCFKLTNEFRHLTNTHSNHEDKLQIKNIIYHTVKDAVSCLTNPLIMTKDEIDLM